MKELAEQQTRAPNLVAGSFAQLFEQSYETLDMRVGSIITGVIVDVEKNWAVVHTGLKSEGIVPISQFADKDGQISLKVGDEVQVMLEVIEDGTGETRLSREKAARLETWQRLEHAFENDETVSGEVTSHVKGGFTVHVDSVRAFLPGSLVDMRSYSSAEDIEGEELEFKILKLDRRRNNIVLSRRAVMEKAHDEEREALLAKLCEGDIYNGIVKNLTEYGAFVDLGGLDGLLHITDMAWERVKHPSEVTQVGDEVRVKVLKFDREQQRVSLGMKQLQDDPWTDILERYQAKMKLECKVTSITDYGFFAQLEPGVEGLVHVSEIDWNSRSVNPTTVVSVGQDVELMVLDINEERRRISLGMKQCKPNPWEELKKEFNIGDRITGKVKSITEFGVFIGLKGGIDGLIYLQDLTWEEADQEILRNYSKGDEIEALILSIETERERVSLGVKQLDDPFTVYAADHQKGSIVTGTVVGVDERSATVQLAEKVNGTLKASDFSVEGQAVDVREQLSEGDEVRAKIIFLNLKNRSIGLSIKACEEQETRELLKEQDGREANSAKIGDVMPKGVFKKNLEDDFESVEQKAEATEQAQNESVDSVADDIADDAGTPSSEKSSVDTDSLESPQGEEQSEDEGDEETDKAVESLDDDAKA